MTERLRFRIEGMDCASCAQVIERGVGRVAGVSDIAISTTTETLSLSAADAGVGAAVEKVVRDLGYAPRRIGDDGAPSERCVALEITGIGDGSAPGVGAACQKTTDTCQRVPDGGACDAWKRREREARATLMFGKAEDKDKNQAEYERVQRVVIESTCGG